MSCKVCNEQVKRNHKDASQKIEKLAEERDVGATFLEHGGPSIQVFFCRVHNNGTHTARIVTSDERRLRKKESKKEKPAPACRQIYSPRGLYDIGRLSRAIFGVLIQDMFCLNRDLRKFGSPTWSRNHYYVVLEQRIELALPEANSLGSHGIFLRDVGESN